MAYKPGRCLLRRRLAEKRWSQQELANRVNMPKSQINDYLSDRKVMSLGSAKSIARVLGCSIDDLYEWIYIPPSERSSRSYE